MTDLMQPVNDQHDFTPTGLRVEGPYENDRNAAAAGLFKAIIREVYKVTDCIIAHHLVYVKVDHHDGFDYQVVEEVPSADTLIFDHDVAKKLWGDNYKQVLMQLACEPCATRDALLAKLYQNRPQVNAGH